MQKDQADKTKVEEVVKGSEQTPTEYNYDAESFQNKIKEFTEEVSILLKDHSYEQRCNWISDMKESGNTQFKESNYDLAIETYMRALCGFEFNK